MWWSRSRVGCLMNPVPLQPPPCLLESLDVALVCYHQSLLFPPQQSSPSLSSRLMPSADRAANAGRHPPLAEVQSSTR
jgi:hypothetical protein